MGRNKRRHKHLPPRMRLEGGAYYYADSRGGRRPWVRLGKTYATAIVRYAALEAATADRRDFKGLAHKYVVEELPSKARATQKVYRSLLKKPLQVFGPVDPADITAMNAYRYVDGRGPGTMGRQEIRLVATILEFGVKKGWLAANPLKGLKLGGTKRRKRYLDDAEIQAMLDAAEPELRHVIRFLLYTALRVNDALGLRWSDWQADGLHVHISKSDKDIIFERTPGLEALMAEMKQRRIGSLYILANKRGRRWQYQRLYEAWKKIRVEDAVLHDLRRRRLTDLARERGIEYAQSVAVHTDPRMTQSYVAGVARVAL